MPRSAKKALLDTQTRWRAAIGALFVAVSFALLLRESLSTERPVAEIAVRVDEILPSAHGYLVSLKIDNVGAGTAASLTVEGVLVRDGKTVETSLVTVNYVAAGSQRDAALFFSSDPHDGQLTVRPKGYAEP